MLHFSSPMTDSCQQLKRTNHETWPGLSITFSSHLLRDHLCPAWSKDGASHSSCEVTRKPQSMEFDLDTPLGSGPNNAVTPKIPTNTHIVEHSAKDEKVVGSDGFD